MADIPASNWSETDASNTSAPPDGMPEGMNPSGVNDWGRAVMGALKRWFDWRIPVTTAGTTAAYTVSYSVAPGALVTGMTHRVLFNATNTLSAGDTTINFNSLGAKPIYKFSGGIWGSLAASDIVTNAVHDLSYHAATGAYRIVSSGSPIGMAFLAVANAFTAACSFAATLTMSGASINEAQGADIPSATTTDIGAATGNLVHVTGTTTITGLGTIQAGTRRIVEFTGALTLTYNAGSLILPGAANIQTVAGDIAHFVSEGAGNWRCVSYLRADGTPLLFPLSTISTTATVTLTGTYATTTGAAPTTGGGTAIAALAKTFTPASASSTLEIEVIVKGTTGVTDEYFLALFDGTTLVDVQPFLATVGGGVMQAIQLRTWYASPGITARSFTVRIGSNSGSSWFLNQTNNGIGGTVAQSGASSWIAIKERPHV